MPNKLQELTDRLYNEGLSKGKAEGEKIVDDARKKAEEILEQAKQEAKAIVEKADKDAEDLKAKAVSDIRMASSQSLQATKKDIEDLLVSSLCSSKVEKACKDKDFIKEIIKAVASSFSAQESKDIALVLPESMKSELESWVKTELSGILGAEVKAEFTKKVQGGFTIAPKDGGYFISLTEDTFKELIAEYLRPVTKKIIFG